MAKDNNNNEDLQKVGNNNNDQQSQASNEALIQKLSEELKAYQEGIQSKFVQDLNVVEQDTEQKAEE